MFELHIHNKTLLTPHLARQEHYYVYVERDKIDSFWRKWNVQQYYDEDYV